MGIVAITGDHPRHFYMVSQIAKTGLLKGWIREKREAFVPEPDSGLSSELQRLYRLHFTKRDGAEHRAFGATKNIEVDCDILDVGLEDLNSPATVKFIKERTPQFVISYGCHKLTPEVLASHGGYAWNCHGGLSPQYRGVHTHFWPSYMLEPQMTGVTLHETTSDIDGGGIIHQTGVTLVQDDGLHDLACRSVREFAEDLPSVLLRAASQTDRLIRGKGQKTVGRIWTTGMWRAEHLVPIYTHHQDKIVNLCLDGVITGRLPTLTTIDDVLANASDQ